MDIYDLRNAITVINYNSHSEGCSIYYIKYMTTAYLTLSNIELFNELIAIGSVDSDCDPETYADYNISQWDALNIAIRHELAKETESDIEKSDIGKAISNFKK